MKKVCLLCKLKVDTLGIHMNTSTLLAALAAIVGSLYRKRRENDVLAEFVTYCESDQTSLITLLYLIDVIVLF